MFNLFCGGNELKYETNVSGVRRIWLIAAATVTVGIWKFVFQISTLQ